MLISIAFAIGIPLARATEEKEETLGDKLKHLLVRHTPTPKPPKEKKTHSSPAAAKSPSAAPSEAPISLPSPPEQSATAPEGTGETLSATQKSKRLRLLKRLRLNISMPCVR